MSSALIVIDVQRGLFDGAPRPFEADLVVDRIDALAGRARGAAVPVVFVQHENACDQLEAFTAPWELVEGLHPQPGDLRIRKTTPDAFLRTGLAELLEKRGVRRVVLCGYASEFCVDTTARRAAALGYEVVLAADAHTTHDKAHLGAGPIRAHHNATLADISSFGPRITAVPAARIAFGEERLER